MTDKKKQQKVIALDIHPYSFSAAHYLDDNRPVREQECLLLQDKLPMENFENWLKKHTSKGDILVMEALNISFQLVKRIEAHGRCGIVLDSTKVGKLGQSYLKTDKADAQKIGKVFLSGINDNVWVPDDETIQRRAVFCSYQNAQKDLTRASNRMWNLLISKNIDVKKGAKHHCEKGMDHLLALRDWSRRETIIISTYFEDYLLAKKKVKTLTSHIAEEVTDDPDMIALQQFLGIGLITSYAFKAIIGNIKRFPNPKKLVAYIGLQPKVHGSGEKMHHGSIAKGGRKDLRSLLSECAQSFMNHAPKDHPLRKWAARLNFRKDWNVVVIAVARKLITSIWYVLSGYGSPLVEITESIKGKLKKRATELGPQRRAELGYVNISHFVEIKSELLLGVT